MTQVIYKGEADVRILGADDLAKAGVEGFKMTRFLSGVPKDVSEDAAAALVADTDLFGLFEIAEEPEAKNKVEGIEAPTGDASVDPVPADSTPPAAKKSSK